jgi:hypothetical protein
MSDVYLGEDSFDWAREKPRGRLVRGHDTWEPIA